MLAAQRRVAVVHLSRPVEGGSANDYDYVSGDPVNGQDLDGRAEHRYYNQKEIKARADKANGKPYNKKAFKESEKKRKFNEKHAGDRNVQKRNSDFRGTPTTRDVYTGARSTPAVSGSLGMPSFSQAWNAMLVGGLAAGGFVLYSTRAISPIYGPIFSPA